MKILLKISTFFIAVIAPIENTLIALLFFVIADLITGVWKASKTEKITSRKLGSSIGKVALYFIAILTAQVCDLYFNLPKIENIVAALIVVTEVLSILENISVITGIPLLDKVKQIFQRPPQN